MRHSYIDRPKRIRAPRATTRARSRFLPVVVALPFVAVLWVTIGLPMLSQLTSARAATDSRGRSSSRRRAAARHGGAAGGAGAPRDCSGCDRRPSSRAYHAEVPHAPRPAPAPTQKTKGAPRALPAPCSLRHSPAPRRLRPRISRPLPKPAPSPPAGKDKSPGTGNSDGGSGQCSAGQLRDHASDRRRRWW